MALLIILKQKPFKPRKTDFHGFEVVHNDLKINHLAIVKNLEERVLEHWHILNPLLLDDTGVVSIPRWSFPPPQVLKLNVDAALKDGLATLAVIVRSDSRHVMNGWTKRYDTTDPCTAEAAAILWAMELAKENNYLKILVEGDAKICIEVITEEAATIPWRILSLVNIIKVLALEFPAYSFCWVRRDANGVAHSLAKFASSLPSCFSCNSSNLPPSVHET
uniref:RNase H type-1 domain-containing protein n=1 Tax=Fagus sylvatica TaxID=28930 RepID=A0A2N9HWJ1_FAGSY